MPCLVRNRHGTWTKLLISEPSAVVFASATLNALSVNRDAGLHTAVLYAVDDEDAETMLERLNAPVEQVEATPDRGGTECGDR